MKQSNYNRFPQGLNVAGVNVLNTYAGNVFWVDSNTGSDGNSGTYRQPLALIDTAIGKCTASNGDIIMVFPGHAETVTTSIAADVAGISIIGLGNGSNRPTLVGPSADATIDVTAANITIRNLVFSADAGTTQAATQKIYVNAANCEISDCEFSAGQYDDDVIYVSTSGTYAYIHDNTFWGTNADGIDTFIYLEGKTPNPIGVVVENNWFNGYTAAYSPDLGHVYSSGVFTHCLVQDNKFIYMSAGGGIEFTQAATGIIKGNVFGGGVQDQMLDPGSCFSFNNYETDAIDASGMLEPTVTS